MTALATMSEVASTQPLDQARSSLSIGTRKSKLALAQVDLVVKELLATCPDYKFQIKARDTAAGDIDKVTPFKDMPVKNLWTHELETLMTEGSLDILVHALKDVPTQLAPNCEIGAVLPREDPRDVFVLKSGRSNCFLADLPSGSVVGTSSIRRTAQIALKYPHLRVQDVRGNIETRLRKLDAEDSPFDAIILAAAGMLRINLGDRITHFLDSSDGNMLYAVGQGAIGIENRCDDSIVKNALSLVNHMPTFLAVTCERSVLRTLEGGCSAPLGVETRWVKGRDGKNPDSTLLMKAIVVSVDGSSSVEVEMEEEITSVEDAEAFGVQVAIELNSRGADHILAGIKAKRPTTTADLQEI